MQQINTDICVIGGGSGGLVMAAGAVQMGAQVVLIERAEMGGDCLNYGCVPSKSLIATANIVHNVKNAPQFGLPISQSNMPPNNFEADIDMAKIQEHIAGIIADIAPHDSAERFSKLGCHVIQDNGYFISPKQLQTSQYIINARYFVVATGAQAMIPNIKGLADVPYLTNMDIFTHANQDNARPMNSLMVIGGGAIGLELAQAHARLGIKTTVIDQQNIGIAHDANHVAILKQQMIDDGVVFYENSMISQCRYDALKNEITLNINDDTPISVSHLLIATGRKPVIGDLQLDKANIQYSAQGIKTNLSLRTDNHRIYAIGDCVDMQGKQFTHNASYQAGIVIRNILFKLPAKYDYSAFPAVTYTSPEIAQAGLSETQAIAKYGHDKVKILTHDIGGNDRARADRANRGEIKIIAHKKGYALGVSIVGAHAGELLTPWLMAIKFKIKFSKIAGLVIPYPTYSEISKSVASSWFSDALFSLKTKKMIQFLLKYAHFLR